MTHSARLTVPAPEVFEALGAIARDNGFDVVTEADRMKIAAPLGTVALAAEASGVRVQFEAASPSDLQMLKELYAGRFAKLGFDAGIQWSTPETRQPLNQVIAEAVSCTQISPSFMRLRLAGAFDAFAAPDAGLHFRFLLGPDDAPWPSLDANGLTEWPGGIAAWHRPVYTTRRIAPDASEIDVDIVLHAGGRVTEWCQNLVAGHPVALTGPSGGKQPKARHLCIMGDATALPVILRMIEDAPAGTTGEALICVPDLADAQEVTTASDIALSWQVGAPSELAPAFLESASLPETDRYVFFAGERQAATQMRAQFKAMGFAAKEAKSASYWTQESSVA